MEVVFEVCTFCLSSMYDVTNLNLAYGCRMSEAQLSRTPNEHGTLSTSFSESMSAITWETIMILFCILGVFPNFGVALVNLECKPRPAVVQTSSDTALDYFPYFVNLHRCSGSQGRTPPQLVRCVADKIEKFKIEAKLATAAERIALEVVNHTSCKNECVMNKSSCRPPARFDKQSCKCICDLGVIGPVGRTCSDPRKMWKDEYCGCMCKNTRKCENRRQYFDQETCSCRCKRRRRSRGACSYYGRDFDPSTCSCYRKSRVGPPSKGKKSTTIYWLAAVAVELFVMLCAFEAFLFTKNSGLVFSAKQRFAASDSSKKSEIDKRNDRMTYKEILNRQQRLSTSVRRRSSRLSSITSATPTAFKSPSYIGEDVFFKD